ncbi:50S ribosomal protein L9, partial [Staphylococcus pseudintermedius]|uniref:50S ribosomal L9 C-terminal domain-containing protein n=1 Tax=Staphylococcus pseudintermedius TaxID=283734 RepID=UPI000E36E5EC
AKALKDRLPPLEVQVNAKSGEGGNLFGSISPKQIVEPLKAQHDLSFDKPKMELPHGIPPLVYPNVPWKRHKRVEVPIRVIP